MEGILTVSIIIPNICCA